MTKVYSPPVVIPGSPRERKAKTEAEARQMEAAAEKERNKNLSVKDRWVEGKINHESDPNALHSPSAGPDPELQRLRTSSSVKELNSQFKDVSPATPSSSYRDEQEEELRAIRNSSSGTVKERNSQFESVARGTSTRTLDYSSPVSKEEIGSVKIGDNFFVQNQSRAKSKAAGANGKAVKPSAPPRWCRCVCFGPK